MLASLSSRQFSGWMAAYQVEAEDAHAQQMEQEAAARAGRPRSTR